MVQNVAVGVLLMLRISLLSHPPCLNPLLLVDSHWNDHHNVGVNSTTALVFIPNEVVRHTHHWHQDLIKKEVELFPIEQIEMMGALGQEVFSPQKIF